MRITIAVFSVVLLAAVAFVVHGQAADSQEAAATDRDVRIRALLVERRDTLRQLVEAVKQHHALGSVPTETVVNAENRLFDAELELADAHEERVRLHREKVENLRKLEELLAARHALGQVTQAEVLEAKAARLAAEVELLRGQANGDPS